MGRLLLQFPKPNLLAGGEVSAGLRLTIPPEIDVIPIAAPKSSEILEENDAELAVHGRFGVLGFDDRPSEMPDEILRQG